MEISVAVQIKEFLLCMLFGLFLGAVYDVFRILRVALPNGKSAVFIEDALFFIISSFLTFSFIFNIHYGILRLYLIIGVLFGFVFYYFTIGRIVLKSAKVIVRILKRGLKVFLTIVFYPIGLVLKIFYPLFVFFKKKIKFFAHFFKKRFSFLKKKYKIVFNRFKSIRNKNKRGANTN